MQTSVTSLECLAVLARDLQRLAVVARDLQRLAVVARDLQRLRLEKGCPLALACV